MATLEHKARRFQQMAQLERELGVKGAEINDSKAHTKELQSQYDGILLSMRAAARDEGDLPLLDMMEDLVTIGKAS